MAAGAVSPPSPPPKLVSLVLITIFTNMAMGNQNVVAQGGASWCVARSDASSQSLQIALDYACGAGADCIPIQSNGLCYLPNTIQTHASYALNSFYQRKARVPGSCDFAGTATIAQTDPSYGSCLYPSSASAAGGTNTPITTPPTNDPNVQTPTTTTPTYITPGMNPPIADNSRASLEAEATSSLLLLSFLHILSLALKPM